MRIGMILETPFPPDIRVEKEARALIAGGHEVLLLCGHKEGQLINDEYEGLRIIRFADNAAGSKMSKVRRILSHWRTKRIKRWETAIDDFVNKSKIEALHIHDLPLVQTALPVARRSRIPLVFDMHEVYPVMIRARFPVRTSFRQQFNSNIYSKLFSASWWDSVEQESVEQADRIVVVVEESKERLVRMGIDARKVFVVLNAEDIDSFLALPEQDGIAEKYQNDFLVGYVGGVDNPNRGLDNLVLAWPLLLDRIANARLIIVGDGPLKPGLEELIRELGLSERITLAGWVPFSKVSSYVKAMDVAVIPHVINDHTNHTIPHKLFQYIALGKLVVASNIVPIQRILEDTGAGIMASEWSPQGFADAITRAHAVLQSGQHDPVRQETILKKKYGFEAVSKPLLELYRGLEEFGTDRR